ncbi:hypothetical protein NQ314_002506 [Rhamnusium bicolor]|uniref:Lipase domain-containing protein n=1 Tax=Rhamnusium bicolor TaxID=1586634 RepID=A0AAV8ZQ47_9CUCU|nr:hypothetical protein NQ314_002506 [Rhamnusium bicolor]
MFNAFRLDPALPFFATFKNDWKLDPSDAKFVDVIHTSAGTFGKLEATGHVDFYVNGGSLQPFCYEKQCKFIKYHIILRTWVISGDLNLNNF